MEGHPHRQNQVLTSEELTESFQPIIGTAVARARGLQRIYGDVLVMNRPMLEFCNRLGFALSRHPGDPTVTRATLQL